MRIWEHYWENSYETSYVPVVTVYSSTCYCVVSRWWLHMYSVCEYMECVHIHVQLCCPFICGHNNHGQVSSRKWCSLGGRSCHWIWLGLPYPRCRSSLSHYPGDLPHPLSHSPQISHDPLVTATIFLVTGEIRFVLYISYYNDPLPPQNHLHASTEPPIPHKVTLMTRLQHQLLQWSPPQAHTCMPPIMSSKELSMCIK